MVTCCPDTGATQTVIHKDIAQQAGFFIDPPGTKVSTATGGESNIRLQYKHHKQRTTPLISSDVRFTVLVA